jgi:hypothetical protein
VTNPRFCSVIAVSDPVAETPLVIEVRCTGAVFGRGGAVLVVQATTPLATSTSATPPRAARSIAGPCHRSKRRL